MLNKEKEMKAEIIQYYLETNGRCSTKELRNQPIWGIKTFLYIILKTQAYKVDNIFELIMDIKMKMNK